MSSSSTAQRDYFPQHIAASAALTHLSLVLFPSTYSDPFLASCLQHWLAQPAPGGSARWTTEQLVERTCEKLLSEEARETSEAGKVVAWVADGFERGEVERGEIGQEEEVKTRWARGKGKGKGKADAPSPSRKGSGGGGKVEDVALARNLALIRLHALFPLVPIVEIRVLLLSLEHTFLYQATEELLLRTGSSLSVRGRGGAAGNEVVDLAEVGRSVLAGLRSLFKRADAAAAEHKGKGKVSTVPAPHDPVFTPQDLFRSPSYTRILLSHFSTLFPSLPHALVRRAVEEEGGSYAAIRAKLEIEAAGKAARSASGRGIGKGKWWNAFGGLFAPPPLSSGVGGSGNREGPADDVQREKDARRIVRESRNRAAEREVEAYYASIERPRMRPRRVHGSERRLEGWVSEVPSPPAPEADEDDPLLSLTSARTVECQCCFADIHLSCSSPTAFSCDASPSSSAHSFCTDCLLTYTRTFITGGTPLPSVSLITIALPCFAAGSPGSPPCRGVLRSSTLRTALDRRTIKQFEARIAAANLEALVAGGSGGEGGLSAAPPKIHRCPFCPYAELAPAPSWGGPLSRAFVPAWGVLWPPDIASVVASALGAVALVVFATLVGVLVLLWPLPLPRLEKIYSDLYPSSTPAPPHPPAAAEADNHRDLPPAPVLPLPLNASLVLSPHHLPPLSLAYLRGITERVIRRKEGKRTVFRCRNLGERKKLGESGREGEEWLSSLEGAEGRMREWLGGDLEEEEGEIEVEAGEAGEGEVEERRRRKLVEIVWGKEAVEALDGQLSATQQGPEEEEEEKCGRLSCLLCSSALNPSAPSLHRCQSPSSLSTSSSSAPGSEAAERERAEESLRLAVERAMSEAVQRRCERCGAGVVKEGGCNKITCRCGAAYCWSCRSPISPSVGYRHFCQHFLPDPIQGCTECSRCSLWKEGDEKGRIREAAAAARRQWALDHPDWARKVDLQGVVVGPPAGLAEGHPLSAVILDSFERTVEYVVLDRRIPRVGYAGVAPTLCNSPRSYSFTPPPPPHLTPRVDGPPPPKSRQRGSPGMVDRAALDARLHAHLHCHLTNDHSVCDELLRPLPHSRHSARSSFIGGPGPVWTGGLVVEGVPTPPRSPLGDVAQLYPPPPHLTPSASPLHSPPRTASPTRPMCGQRSARMRPLSASGSPSNGHSPMFDEEHEEQGKKAGGAVPSTDVWGHLKVEIVEAKDLAVEDTSKPYVLLQYDRTDSVSREWGAPSASSTSDNDGEKKRGANGLVRRRQANNGGTTTRRVVGGSSTTSTSTAADPSPVASAFGSKSTSTSSSSASTSPTGSSSHRTSTSISSLPSQSLPLPSSKPPKYNPSLTLRPVSPSPPSLPPEVIGTARSPIWHHHATFDVIAPGRTVLVCVYDKLAPQGGDEKRFHGFAGACVFEPPLLEDVGDEAEEEGEGEGPRKEKDRWVDVWVPLTSALDETIGGEIRLRILFEPMQSRPRLSIADFQLLRLIGQGSFGSVFRVRKRDTKRIYALKVIRKAGVVDDPSGRALQQVWTERKILEGNNMSPFLCGLKFSFQDERAFFFALDYKAGGEMFQHLQRDGGRFEEAKVRFYVAEIVLALGFLHDRGIVYRDLKPENCLLDGSGHVVLCDFGLSKILDNEPEQKTRTLCGTTSFLAPEVLLDVGYSYPSDFWSLGVLLFEMCFGWSPFYAENRMEEYERILSMEIKIPNKKGYGEEVKDLLRRLLERDVPLRLGARTGAAEIHSHPFFSPIDWPRLALRQLPPPFKPPTHADDDQPDWNDDGRQWRFDLDLGGGGGYYESHARGSCGGGGRKSVKSGANLTRGFTYHLKEDKQKWWDKRAEELWGGGEGKEAAVQEEGEGEGNENGVGGRKKSEVERFKQGEMDCGTRRSSCG